MSSHTEPPALEIRGSGEGVLFLHGYPLHRAMWNPQLSALSDTHRIALLDLPGYGTAADAAVPDTMVGFGEAVRTAIVEKLGGRTTVVAHSFGGYVALQLYADHPELFERLVLVSTRSGADSAEARDKRMATARRLKNPGEHLDVGEVTKSLLAESTWTAGGPVVTVTKAIVGAAPNPTVVRTLTAIADRPDQAAVLPAIDVPTLVIWGEKDGLIPPAQTRELVGAIPEAQGVEIAGAGHLSPLERSDAFNAALRGFLTRTAGRPGTS
jgi:3-oxoadipate enol-lactonase